MAMSVPHRSIAVILAVVFAATIVQIPSHSSLEDGNQVLETLRSTAFDPIDHEIRALRARLTAGAYQFARGLPVRTALH